MSDIFFNGKTSGESLTLRHIYLKILGIQSHVRLYGYFTASEASFFFLELTVLHK
jgi:hypothetical protein